MLSNIDRGRTRYALEAHLCGTRISSSDSCEYVDCNLEGRQRLYEPPTQSERLHQNYKPGTGSMAVQCNEFRSNLTSDQDYFVCLETYGVKLIYLVRSQQ